jgi:GNAT superfamily N-acetyltransferase
MTIVEASILSEAQKQAVHQLWNEEYPVQIMHKDIGELEAYLNNLTEPHHYLAVNDDNEICGWAFAFDRDNERWFAIIVGKGAQRRGLGSLLLNKLKADEQILNGWAADHDNDRKRNGEVYKSPLGFYEKNGFEIRKDIRLDHPSLSVIKISWRG